jgi:hypothetical protein
MLVDLYYLKYYKPKMIISKIYNIYEMLVDLYYLKYYKPKMIISKIYNMYEIHLTLGYRRALHLVFLTSSNTSIVSESWPGRFSCWRAT